MNLKNPKVPPTHGMNPGTANLGFWVIIGVRVATVMEKSWNFWNFEIFWNFWKCHGILTKIAKGHGTVMEFDKQILNYHESAPLRGSFSNFNQHVRRYRGHGIL